MKTITFESNYGNFAYRITAEVGENLTEATEWLALQGIANIAYRVAGSAVDKAMGVKVRKELLFTPEAGEQISAAVSKKLTELEAKDEKLKALKCGFAVTGQHEFGATGEVSKEVQELWGKVQALYGEAFAKALTNLRTFGFPEGEDYEDEDGLAACKALLRKVKEDAKKAAQEAVGI